MFTDKGNIYVACCDTFQNCCNKTDDDYSILNNLLETGDTRVLKIVAVIKQRGEYIIDVPCAWLRNCIYDMNNDNIDAEVKLCNSVPRLIGFLRGRLS